MPVVTLPYRRTVRNAPLNAAEAAKLILNNRNARVCGRSAAEGLRCCMCGRKPPSDHLFEIILDPVADTKLRIGVGRCHGHHLAAALGDLLRQERAGRHPDRDARIRHLGPG
jgi:hypothetical protein